MPARPWCGESVTLTIVPPPRGRNASSAASRVIRSVAADVEPRDGAPALRLDRLGGREVLAAGVVDERVEAAAALEREADDPLGVAVARGRRRRRRCRPSSAAVAASTSSRRPQITTSAPQRRSSAAAALPSPVPPPVTSTARPASAPSANISEPAMRRRVYGCGRSAAFPGTTVPMQIPGVHIETLHNPTRYSYAQIEKACTLAALLNRGKLVLVEPPRTLGATTGWAGTQGPPSRPSDAQPSTTAGRELVERAQHDVGGGERLVAGRELVVGDRDHAQAGRARGEDAVVGVLDARRRRAGSTPSRRAASRNTSGAGLPRATSSDETQVRKTSPQPDVAITRSMTSLLEDEASASGQRAAIRATACLGAGQQRQPLLVALEHVRDDAVGDLVRLERDAELVAHVARPLGRAHAEHGLRRPVRPLEAVLGGERPAAAVPGGLRVEQEAVEVEDDGADQAGDQGIEPRSAVLETAIVAIGPVPQGDRPARL